MNRIQRARAIQPFLDLLNRYIPEDQKAAALEDLKIALAGSVGVELTEPDPATRRRELYAYAGRPHVTIGHEDLRNRRR